MSVSWPNRRRGQSLAAHGRVKKQQQNNMFFKLRLNELSDCESENETPEGQRKNFPAQPGQNYTVSQKRDPDIIDCNF